MITSRAEPMTVVHGVILIAMLAAVPVAAQPELQADSLRTYSTLHSIGFEWDITGDANHDATGKVRYRQHGAAKWQDGFDLLRVDFQGFFGAKTADRHYNMLAGSLFFLDPGTIYEAEVTLTDQDGGSTSRLVTVKTRPIPRRPTDLRYVHAGSTLGDGSRSRPLTLDQATTTAAAGTGHCLLSGDDGEVRLVTPGTRENHVGWYGPGVAGCEDEDGTSARLTRLEIAADHQWIEGLHFSWDHAWPDSVTRGGLRSDGARQGMVVWGNTFRDYSYSIWLDPDSDGWLIADNDIVGRKDIEQEGSAAYSGEGIELQYSSDHTVAYNTISTVADGISYAKRNCDLFGNDIFDTSDDAIEPDYGYANIRMWGNRIANVQAHAFSFQGMHSGPWYFLRNQVNTARGAIFKFRVTDRFVFANNTVVAPTISRDIMHHLLHGVIKNNLFIRDGIEEREPWQARLKFRGDAIEKRYFNPDITAPDWRSDWSHSGYDLRNRQGDEPILQWFDMEWADIGAFADAVGADRHSRHMHREDIFAQYQSPTHPARQPRPLLQLHPQGPAIDAGVVLPGLVEAYTGRAPDLGAHEVGAGSSHYGIRPRGQRHQWMQW